jgi:hypothetical protein
MLQKLEGASEQLQALQSTYLANVSIEVAEVRVQANNTLLRYACLLVLVCSYRMK